MSIMNTFTIKSWKINLEKKVLRVNLLNIY